MAGGAAPAAARGFLTHLESRDQPSARRIRPLIMTTLCGASRDLPSPVGETNIHMLTPRGRVLCVAESWPNIIYAIGLALSTGNLALVLASDSAMEWARPEWLVGEKVVTDNTAALGGDVALMSLAS